MRQLVVASTFFQCLTLVAAIDAGALPGADERILVLADGSQTPELTVPLAEQDGFAVVASRFDRVVDLAALLYPRRPVQFAPRLEEHAVWERLLRSHWQLGDEPVQVIMDFVQVNPAYSLAGVFAEADLWTHSDGLMTYSPTRRTLPLRISQRLSGLVHLDLVPGLQPKMLVEHGVEQRPVPLRRLWPVLDEVLRSSGSAPEAGPGTDGRPTALVLGQYLSNLGLITAEEEVELNTRLVVEAARRGAEVCLFKPHPAAPPARTLALQVAAVRAGVELVVDTSHEIAELTMRRRKPHWVISCFSTGLASARYLLGIEAVAVGTGEMLARLNPYENSNRVPLVLADLLFSGRTIGGVGFEAPDEHDASDPRLDLQRLVDAVAYCMQPVLLADRVEEVRCYLRDVADEPELLATVFRRRRLTALGLPGGLPAVDPIERLRRSLRRRLDRLRALSGGPSR